MQRASRRISSVPLFGSSGSFAANHAVIHTLYVPIFHRLTACVCGREHGCGESASQEWGLQYLCSTLIGSFHAMLRRAAVSVVTAWLIIHLMITSLAVCKLPPAWGGFKRPCMRRHYAIELSTWVHRQTIKSFANRTNSISSEAQIAAADVLKCMQGHIAGSDLCASLGHGWLHDHACARRVGHHVWTGRSLCSRCACRANSRSPVYCARCDMLSLACRSPSWHASRCMKCVHTLAMVPASCTNSS